MLSHYGIVEAAYQPLWDKLGQAYFLRHEIQEIAWHSRLLLTHVDTQKPIVRARLSSAGDGIQVMIYTRDRDDLFARICGFFERLSYTILEARVHTSQHCYALDSFIVTCQSDSSLTYRDVLSYIEYELTKKLLTSSPLDIPLQGRLSRQVKHMPIKTEVSIKADGGNDNHVLEIIAGDRPGLLSRVAQIFLKHEVHLHTAKINTLGNRAEDIFVISAKSGLRLNADTVNAVEHDLLLQF